jgi:hypothetical protein
MSNSPAPTNYSWIGNTLTFDLAPEVTGVKIKFKKDGASEWTEILNSPGQRVNHCTLDASIYGPSGTVWGATEKGGSSGGGWGTPSTENITNS